MDKNILIIGAARSGKTTLARNISKKYNYNLISLDDIISGFEGISNCNIKHDGDEIKTSKNFSRFLKGYLKELSEGPNFYNNCKFVIEGTHIDFEELIPYINNELKDKYEVIGLTYNNISEKELYDNIKKYDTEDDWTYYNTDDELKGNVKYFIERNNYFNDKYKEYNIKTYDTSFNRDNILNNIINDLFEIKNNYICKIATIDEMNKKWDYEISQNPNNNAWKVWKKEFIAAVKEGKRISYYGILDGNIICETTAYLSKDTLKNSKELIDEKTAYLGAFRTIEYYQGKGYFSILYKYMENDLKQRGYKRLTLGVEPSEVKNMMIYFKYGFINYIKTDIEEYPKENDKKENEKILVNYYSKEL